MSGHTHFLDAMASWRLQLLHKLSQELEIGREARQLLLHPGPRIASMSRPGCLEQRAQAGWAGVGQVWVHYVDALYLHTCGDLAVQLLVRDTLGPGRHDAAERMAHLAAQTRCRQRQRSRLHAGATVAKQGIAFWPRGARRKPFGS
eukprot:13125295-Heterocapsa_arctica.AAC.4